MSRFGLGVQSCSLTWYHPILRQLLLLLLCFIEWPHGHFTVIKQFLFSSGLAQLCRLHGLYPVHLWNHSV